MIGRRRNAFICTFPDVFGRPTWYVTPFAARVTTTGRSAMTIQVTDATGSWPEPGEVAYIGTESEPFRYVTRVRSVNQSTGTIGIAENEIEFGTYATRIYCPHLHVVLPKFQRVRDVDGTPTVWKDYDLTPMPLPPKVNVRGPFVCSANEPVVLDVSWFSMEHNATGGSISVTVPGGTASLNGNQLTVVCSEPGFRYVTVSVTDSAGTGVYRHPLFVGCPRDRAVVSRYEHSERDGWMLEVEADFPPEETPYVEPFCIGVFVYGDTCWYGFCVSDDSELDYAMRRVRLRLQSSIRVLSSLRGHAFTVEDGQRTSWYYLPSLTVARAAHMLLEFHSTFNAVTPVVYCDEAIGLAVKSNAFHDGTLHAQLTSDLLDDALLSPIQLPDGTVMVRRRPNLAWERGGIQTVDVPASEISIERSQKVGLMKVGGFAYDTPMLARAPGTCPDIWGSVDEREGLIVRGQDDLNKAAGLLYSDANAPVVHARRFGDALPYVVPGTSYYSFGSVVADVTSVTVRQSGVILELEAEGKARTSPLPGETITVPPAPPPYVPDWPIPPTPEPPLFVPSGLALVRARHFIVRTMNVYSYYPIWEVIFDAREHDGDSQAVVVDFRYVERSGHVAVVVLTDLGNVYYTADISATPVTWYRMFSGSQLISAYDADTIEVFQLMTLVHDSNYAGLTFVAHRPGYSKVTGYAYTDSWGQSWSYVTIRSDFVYAHKPVSILNTAGTNELVLFTSNGIWGTSTRIYRSLDAGRTWGQYGVTGGPTSPTFKSYKPWQYGTGGQIIYAQPNIFNAELRLGKSTDFGGSWSEKIPNHSNYQPACRGFEVWTFDPQLVVAALRSTTSPYNVRFFRSNDGAESWSLVTDTTIESQGGDASISVRGNPANRDEWTVLDCTWGEYGPVRLVQTLDGGQTWRSLMGNWYEVPGLVVQSGTRTYRWFGEDYLIIPPFKVVRSVE